jgi:hypothetical protein
VHIGSGVLCFAFLYIFASTNKSGVDNTLHIEAHGYYELPKLPEGKKILIIRLSLMRFGGAKLSVIMVAPHTIIRSNINLQLEQMQRLLRPLLRHWLVTSSCRYLILQLTITLFLVMRRPTVGSASFASFDPILSLWA